MSDTRTVLFELGTEELPPFFVGALWKDLWDAAQRRLHAAGLLEKRVDISKADNLFTSRRLALSIPGVRSETLSKVETRRGPALKSAFDEQGQPTKALLGFMRSCGAREEQVECWRAGEDCLETDKGAWVIFKQVKSAQPVHAVLPEIMQQAVADITLDVRMRWGAGEEEFARPVRWVILLYGDEVVHGSLMGLRFGQESRGHRFLSARPVVIDNAEEYGKSLHKRSVLVRWEDRYESLSQQVEGLERELRQKHGNDIHIVWKGTRGETDSWMTNLRSAEWPQAILGKFDERFLQLPKEVVTTILEDQQQYFPVVRGDTKLMPYWDMELMPYFVAVANLEDKKDRIRAGCERVVQARLQDAEFYLRQDQQCRLRDRVADLERVVFHRKLGTLAARTRRIKVLAGFVAKQIGSDEDEDLAMRAAHLCKADLTTDMVQAFPRLQGVMGAHYARADNVNEIICEAIEKHYWHRPPKRQVLNFSDSALATITALSLADRLDMLIGIFAVGEIPTGTRDPLGVRRAADDVVYLLLRYHWPPSLGLSDIDMDSVLEQAAAGYPASLNARKAVSSVRDYLTGRLRHDAVGAGGYAPDEVEAVLAVPWHHPKRVFQRLDAVKRFRKTKAGAVLAEANKRIRNILRKTEPPAGNLDPELLREPAEQALAERVAALRPEVEKLCRERQYEQAMEQLAALAEPVAKFFDDVLVMAEEPEMRHNRLRLLRDVRELFLTIADLSRLQGGPKET